jgi:hypothetical protein
MSPELRDGLHHRPPTKDPLGIALSGTAKVWAGSADLPLATEELARMEELGWFTDEDSWSAFT